MADNLFNHLNQKQKEAVSYINGPSVILAGAGSGKTRVLVYKVINLIKIHRISPSSIVMITFTNKAGNEMRERIGVINLGFIGTFHSFCSRILRREADEVGYESNFAIYDENDQLSLVKSILKTAQVTTHTPSYFLNRISTAKNQLITYKEYLDIFSDHAAAQTAAVYEKYQKELIKARAFDFDDLIMKTVELFSKDKQILDKYQNKYRYFFVDEFQDTNYSQYVLIKLLASKDKKVTVVGDFSQSIYSWRGADMKNLEKFEQDFPQVKVFYLEENYRSTQKILDFAYSVISQNQTHPVLQLFTRKRQGEEINYYEAENEEYEAIYVTNTIESLKTRHPYSSSAVLYRINAQSRVIEEALLHYGIPYVLIGGTRFYERKEIKDVLSYLRLLINPADPVSLARITKLSKKYWQNFLKDLKKESIRIKNKTTNELMEEIFSITGYLKLYSIDDEEDYSRLENIKELKSVAISFPDLTRFLERVALVESEYFEGEKTLKQNKFASGQAKDDRNRVKLMTLHQAKGLEFPLVFIVGVEEGILPHSRSMDDRFQLEEERRLFYVGITRAKEKLFITNARKRFIFGRRSVSIKSRFISNEADSFI